MNTSSGPLVGVLGRLTTGVSNVGIRWAHSRPRHRQPKYHLTGFKEGLGEHIFVFNHIEDGMIIHSHDNELRRDSKKLLDQIPYTAKKLKPPVLRKDYWEPLCMIRFDKGQGEIGRNVFQKLREFRRMHELAWGWQAKDLIRMNKKQRGKTILDQKRNAIADIAAVLGGAGRGNLMWTMEPEPEPEPKPETTDEKATTQNGDATETAESGATEPTTEQATTKSTATEAKSTGETTEKMTEESTTVGKSDAKSEMPQKRLWKTTIYWANDSDLNWAREWTSNVEHQIGLPDDVKVPRWETRKFHYEAEPEPVKEEESAESEGKDGEPKDGEPKDGEPKEGESKEGKPKEGEPKEGEPKEGEPKEGEPEEGEPKQSKPTAKEKIEQQGEKQEPVKKGVFGALFGRK